MKTDNDARVAGRGIRQSMSSLHTWAGLLLGWFLYAMFLTGTVSYFKDELSQWMRPELPRQSQVPDQAVVAQRIADELGNHCGRNLAMEHPPARRAQQQRLCLLADDRAQSGPARLRRSQLRSRDRQEGTSRDTLGGEFFFRFHFQFHYMPVVWGRWLAGAAAMFMLVAIVSGVITHKKIFVDFFTFRWGKGQRSWLEAHNALSVFGLPFHSMITYTGFVTLMAMYMPWGEHAAFKTPAERQQSDGRTQRLHPAGQAQRAESAARLGRDMVRQAQERWGRDNVGRVNAVHPGDAAARIAVTRGDARRVSMSPQYMEFEGATGKLLSVRERSGQRQKPEACFMRCISDASATPSCDGCIFSSASWARRWSVRAS